MKPKTKIKTIRLKESTIEIWQLLTDHNFRAAEIFKAAGEKALNDKLTELKIEQSQEYCPF